jgi:glutaredoxin
MSITVYSKTACAPCKTLKYWMAGKGLQYTEKSLEVPQNASECESIAGRLLAPTILIEKDGLSHVISGLNFTLLGELLT